MSLPLSTPSIRNIVLERAVKFQTSNEWQDVNLRSAIYSARVPVQSLEACSLGRVRPHITATFLSQLTFRPVHVGDSFGPTWSTHVFRIGVQVPKDWVGGEVHLLFDPSCEGCVYVNGQPVQGITGSANDRERRIEFTLTQSAKGGDVFEVFIETACNDLFGAGNGGLINHVDENKTYALRRCEIGLFNRTAWDLLWDYNVIVEMAQQLPAEDPRGAQALYVANAIQNVVWTDNPKTFAKGRELAQQFLAEKNATSENHFRLAAIGHCHIDTAWLWPYAETRRKVIRSWSSQLRLAEQYPFHKFGASQAVQYEWLREDAPGLFERLKAGVQKGNFIPIGGTWVEMDANLPSGESFCRQFIYGQRFFRENFGAPCQEFWLPDTFGYAAQLPQIMRAAGINFFVTQKLCWNNINKFPYSTFHWEGLDGSRVLTHFPPGDTYCAHVSAKDLVFSVSNFKDKDKSQRAMLVFGYGDGGGGPSSEMLERVKRFQDVRGLPRVEPKAPAEFLKDVVATSKPLAVWSGELYFELHRGTYTTQARTKKGNRKCEFRLREVELWYTVASFLDDKVKYPREEIERLWKLVLLNQFHDVLPGSSITDVYKDAERYYAEVSKSADGLLKDAFAALHGAGGSGGSRARVEDAVAIVPGMRVFNSLSWPRREVLPSGKHWVDIDAMSVAHVVDEPLPDGVRPVSGRIENGIWILDNHFLTAKFASTGRLISLVHKETGRECISSGHAGNTFVIFDDVSLFWDAWDTEITHLGKKFTVDKDAEIFLNTDGTTFQVSLTINVQLTATSRLSQRVVLTAFSERLDFITQVHWDENRKFLKVEFPTTVFPLNGMATFDTQFGYLQRPAHRNTSWDQAKFEVCAHKWADISDFGFGVALLNDCKYGYAVEGSTIRLSLLRSSKAPDAFADIGEHTFTYSLCPHAGPFQSKVIQEAYSLNCPLIVEEGASASGAWRKSFFSIDNPAVIIETVKKSDVSPHNSSAFIVRLYEAHGSVAKFTLTTTLRFAKVDEVTLLEDEVIANSGSNIVGDKDTVRGVLSPFKFITLRFTL